MEGRSGCELIIEYNDNQAIIKKYSNSKQYNFRLVKQAEKQRDFYQSHINSAFSTAAIFEIETSENDLAWFSMSYVFAEKFSNHLDQINIRQVKKLLNNFIQYFNSNIKSASEQKIDKEVFENKLYEIRLNISKNPLTHISYFSEVIAQLENYLPDKPLPIGICHGDFTFSNILFGEQEMFLLDFLDSFIESPVIDIVKLRQDTCYKWSIMLEKDLPLYKSNKLCQIMDYFDREIEAYCNSLGMQEWYIFLQTINLLRIVPYLKVQSELLFIENALKSLLNESYPSHGRQILPFSGCKTQMDVNSSIREIYGS